MTQFKIKGEPVPGYQTLRVLNNILRAKKAGVPVCQACGKPLTDPISIKRGYGNDCWEALTVAIVIEIPSAVEA